MNVICVTLSSLISAILVSGCATSPSPQQLAEADYGPPPDMHEDIIKDYMGRLFKDPQSAQYNFLGTPRKMWFRQPLGSSFTFGWGTCALINAKNSFGGYVGYQKHFFLIKNNQVIQAPGSGIASETPCASIGN